MDALRLKCQKLLDTCSGGLALHLTDKEFQEMRGRLNSRVCWYLTCERLIISFFVAQILRIVPQGTDDSLGLGRLVDPKALDPHHCADEQPFDCTTF